MSFVPSDFISKLPGVDRPSADAAPFGIVQVDDQGTIKLYNKWESDMAGVPVGNAEGRNFFTQVAPCTNNRLVFGRFKDGVAKGEMDSEFNYTFTYKMKPTNVQIRLFRHQPSATNWVLVGLRTL
jgi:photoactive yellow protein